MFAKDFAIMLYVDDVSAEKKFWEALGFVILRESKVMEYDSFDMKPHKDSSCMFTVYDKAFIRQVSPEVIDMKPSILFESADIVKLQERAAKLTDTASPLLQEPFLNFHFASPGGQYFAVKGV